jgi:predicted nucleotidyltransferase
MLNRDFKEFIKSLNDSNVRYMIVGGYAVALHGHPRYTKDLDVWIEMSPENAANLIEALERFGFGSLGLVAEDFLVADQIVQLGYPPNRIDLLVSLKGIDFENSYATRIEVPIDEILVNFIDLENLKKNKKATGRLQDLADVESLE